MSQLKVALIQTALSWEDPSGNYSMLENKLSSVGEADLVVLPEMFATGFSMNTEAYADKDGSGLEWLTRMAERYETALVGSLMVSDMGKAVNRLYFVEPGGTYSYYDKRHLFTMGSENEFYHPGKKRLLVEYKGWKICPLICYDLRFPVFSRNDLDYDLLIYVANWPEKRSFHWKTLNLARAIENQSYLLACNRVGLDGNGISYSGDSMVLDFKGETLDFLTQEEGLVKAVLDRDKLNKGRADFPVLNDRDRFRADWK